MASCLKKEGFTVKVIDDAELDTATFLSHYKKNRPRILGFHVNTDAVPSVGRVLAILRSEQLLPELIIFGGPHVTIEDNVLLDQNWGDIVVRGEGELTTVEIGNWFLRSEGRLADINGITYKNEDGKIIRNPDRPFIKNLDSLPVPDMSVLVKNPRFTTYKILTGRGCPFHCTFCAEGINGIKYRFRSPESVLEEIYSMAEDKGRIYLGILDDTFLVDRKRVEKIASGLIKKYGGSERIKWFCEGRVDFIIKNPGIFQMLKEAGLVRIQIGIESGNQQVLDMYRKEVKVEEIIQAVEIIKEGGIPSIYGNFIIGGPFETDDTISESIDLAAKLIETAPGRMECASCFLGLYPGTAISKNPAFYGLDVHDPGMMTCISLHHPVATPKGKSKHWVLEQYYRFNHAILIQYQKAMANVPMELIEEHLKLREYDVTTKWSDLFLSYPCIKQCEYMSKKRFEVDNTIPDSELLNLIPRRSVNLMETTGSGFTVTTHPQGPIVLNEMAGEIYELCSGKYRLGEIIASIRERNNNLPPEPFYSKQALELIKDLRRRFLIYYSDI